MMARFSADQAVLQAEQSLMLVPHQEVCKREILVVFLHRLASPSPKLQGKQSRGALHNGVGWCCSLSGLLPKPADLPPCQEEKLDALLRGLYLLE